MSVTHTSTITGRGAAPFRTAWLAKTCAYAIYPPTTKETDSAMQLAMYDFYFGADALPNYRVFRGPRTALIGSRPVRGPRLYTTWQNA